MYRKDYTYQLERDSDSQVLTIQPRFGNDFAIVSTLENNQVFHRDKLSGSIELSGSDFDFVNDSAVTVKFTFIAYKKGVEQWRGKFFKTGCKFDKGKKLLEVQPEPIDKYDLLLAGLEKEFNLIDLKPQVSPVRIRRQGVIQTYGAGDGFLTNFVGSTYWEQQVVTPTSDDTTLTDYYYFSDMTELFCIPGNNLSPDVSGIYTRIGVTDHLLRDDGLYETEPFTIVDPQDPETTITTWKIRNVSTQVVVYEGEAGVPQFGTIFTSETSSSTCQVFQKKMYARLITNESLVSGTPTTLLNSSTEVDSDIVEANKNYTRGMPVDGNFIASINVDSTFDVYGQTDSVDCNNFLSTDYFHQPSPSPTTEKLYPVSRSSWSCFSLWFHYDDTLRTNQEDASVIITIQDAYRLGDVISILVNELDPSLTYVKNFNYSKFLHSTNPIDNMLFARYVIPKGNIIVGQYDTPAKRANIKLSQVFEMLWKTYRCKWFIDDQSRLRIEGISFFENGHSYTSEVIGIDVSGYTEPRTNIPWGYLQEEFSYKKNNMPERYITKWMDEVSLLFEGYPVVMLSDAVNQGQVEEEKISVFTSDIDFIIANPSEVSNKGFVIAVGELGDGISSVSFLDYTLNGQTYSMQNGHLSTPYLHENFHRYNLPCLDVRINEQTTTALSQKKNKTQNLEFAAAVDINPSSLIKTTLGTGSIETLSQGLETNTKKITIGYVAD